MRIATVDAEDKVISKKVRLGRNLGDEVEIRSGLSLSDRVIDSPQESILPGGKVRIAGAKDVVPEMHAVEEESHVVAPPGI